MKFTAKIKATAIMAAVLVVGQVIMGASPADTGAGAAHPPKVPQTAPAVPATPAQALAEKLLHSEGVRQGLCVQLGCGDGLLTAELPMGGKYVVQGLTSNRAELDQARSYLRAKGLYGPVSVDYCAMKRLPYADNVANVIIAEDLPALLNSGLPLEEILRVLAPFGVAFLKGGEVTVNEAAVSQMGEWTRLVKPYPKDLAEWPQLTYDGTGADVSPDQVVGPLRSVRWIGGDVWPRKDPVSLGMVSAQGRNFYQLTGAGKASPPSIVCRDAFNGLVLWKWPAGEAAPLCMAAVGNRLYTTRGWEGRVVALDAASGELVKTYDCQGAFVYRQGKLILMNPGLKTRNFVHASGRMITGEVPRKLEARHAETGSLVWQYEDGLYSFVVGDYRVLLISQDRKQLVSLDLDTGKVQWRVPVPPGVLPDPSYWWGGGGAAKPLVYSKELLFVTTYAGNPATAPSTLPAAPPTYPKDDQVFIHQGPPPAATMHVFSARDGQNLWSRALPVPLFTGGGREFFFLDKLIWAEDFNPDKNQPGTYTGQITWVGLDPATGAEQKRCDFNFFPYTTDVRKCYGSRATERYIFSPDMQMFDTREGKLYQFYGGRGLCGIGSLLANGLVYKGSLACACFAHFQTATAFSTDAPPKWAWTESPAVDRLEKGPAYGAAPAAAPPSPEDWPTLRHDPSRSGSTTASVPADLQPLWKTKVDAQISSPVVAEGRILVAAADAHRVVALDAEKGALLWSYTAGARGDSPPTIHSGLALFGSRDGYVYCLQASDGTLVWRFRAAPEDRQIMVNGQLESQWPVFGSVPIDKGLVYFAAGRHTETDGGIFLYAAEPHTGKILWAKQLVLRGPFDDRPIMIAEPHTATNDILVCDGKNLLLDSIEVNLETRADTVKTRSAGALWGGVPGFLYDSCEPPFSAINSSGGWLNWLYIAATRDVGWRIHKLWGAKGVVASGELLAIDGHRIFGARNIPVDKTDSRQVSRIYLIRPTAAKEKEFGNRPEVWQNVEQVWKTLLPDQTLIKALLPAGDKIFVAARPGALPAPGLEPLPEAPVNGVIRLYSTADGRELGQIPLGARPRFDGLAATPGRLYVATDDGSIICLGKN